MFLKFWGGYFSKLQSGNRRFHSIETGLLHFTDERTWTTKGIRGSPFRHV